MFDEISAKLFLPSRTDYDLRKQDEVIKLLSETKPHIVFHFAGLVGGLQANMDRPADFCYENLLMQTMMMQPYISGAEKYITLMGGCSYPERHHLQ